MQQGIGGQAAQGVEAEGGVVVVFAVQTGVEPIPVAIEQLADQCQSLAQAGQAIQGDAALHQVVGDAQVLAAPEQPRGQVADLAPLGRLGSQHGIAHLPLGQALGGTLQFEKGRIVFQVVATGGFCANSREQQW
ncbi:hypothetical protein D9M69_507120 [compost metagenome]